MNDKLADSIIYDKKQYIAELKAEVTAKDARIAELEAALKAAADMAGMSIAVMFEMGEISISGAMRLVRAAIERKSEVQE